MKATTISQGAFARPQEPRVCVGFDGWEGFSGGVSSGIRAIEIAD